MKFNKDIFLQHFRKAVGTPLTSTQVRGVSFLLDKIEGDPDWGTDLRQIAYFLATIWHETGATFQPIKEIRERTTSPRRANQDRYWKTNYYGRGYVQITWKGNYAKFGVVNPDDALNPEVAYRIASTGMRSGMFTGHKLKDFATPTAFDYVRARSIINGHDRATEIAAKAVKLQACLALSLVRDPEVVPEKVTAPAPEPVTTESSVIKATGVIQSVREKYSTASEGEKSIVARVGQAVWALVLGAIAFIQTHPVQTGIVLLVLLLGFWAFHRYANRQDTKTFLSLK